MPKPITRVCVLAAILCALAPVAVAQTLAAAVLPSGRSVTVGATATAYASVINAGTAAATGRRISSVTQVAALMQSRADALSLPGYMEETGCTNSVGAIIIDDTNCIQRGTTTDFSLQAIMIEAQLELIGAANLPAASVIGIADFWQNDFMSADGPTFPNIATSIRNKPAEGIVKQWFAR